MNSSTSPTFLGFPAQFDLGNFTVGMATLVLAGVTIFATVFANNRSKRQRISDFRKEWIENLRSHFAEFQALTFEIGVRSGLKAEAENIKNAEQGGQLNLWRIEKFNRLVYLQSYLLLMLNKRETRHQMMERKMKEIIDDLIENQLDARKSDLPSFRELARDILKTEWDRVRRQS